VTQGTRMGSIIESLAKEVGAGREFRDVEVSSMSQRRRFTVAYKRRVLAEADACTEPGQVGAMLRREGLYSSHLTTWRRQREQGVLEALTPKKRGRKARGLDPLAQRVAQLERDNARLSHQLKQAETIIEVQKKVSELLGMSREGNPPGGSLSWQPRGD
jgi:transposase